MKCPECGKELNAGARFCTGCGAQNLVLDAGAPQASGPGRGVPAPPPRKAPAAGIPRPPASDAPGEALPAAQVFTPQHTEKPAPGWQRMPRRARTGLAITAALLAAAALVFTVRYFMLGGASCKRVSGFYMRPGAGFSLELPGKNWYTPNHAAGDVDEPGVFYRGRGPGAPVTLSVFHGKARTPMPNQLVDFHATFLKDYFVKQAERLLVRDGVGFEMSKIAIFPGMGPRSGLLLEGKALPADGSPYPVYVVFTYDQHEEYTLVFQAPGKNPAQYKKEILDITRSFRIE